MKKATFILMPLTIAWCMSSSCHAGHQKKEPQERPAMTAAQLPAAADTLQEIPADEEQAIRKMVAGFGAQLRMVSLLAPADILSRDMKKAYGPYVTGELLQQWIQDPSKAPGREVSSPWPERIEITKIQPGDKDHASVEGEIIYNTSSGSTHDHPKVTMGIARQPDGNWLIDAFKKE